MRSSTHTVLNQCFIKQFNKTTPISTLSLRNKYRTNSKKTIIFPTQSLHNQNN